MTTPPVRHESAASSEHDEQSGRRRRLFIRSLTGIVLLVGTGVAAVEFLPVPVQVTAGTRVAGVDVGGFSRAELRTALSGPISERVQRPVQIRAGTESFQIVPAQAGITLDQAGTERALLGPDPSTVPDWIRGLRSQPRDLPPVIAVDQNAARAALTAHLAATIQAPRDARVELATPQPILLDKGDASFTATGVGVHVVPAQTGRGVDLGAGVKALRRAVIDGRPDLELPVVLTQPGIGTDEMAGVDQLIGTFTTQFVCCQPRVTNIKRMAELIDGQVIAPNSTFSLNQAAGRRTTDRGFVAAGALVDGELVDQIGGGVSQFSTTLFNAAWFAGLSILKHQPHSKYISRYPPGREATLDFDSIDQVILNNTSAPVVVRTATTSTSVTVALYGHTGSRVVTSTTGPREPRPGGGFSVGVDREVRQDGTPLRQDHLGWTYIGTE